MYLKVLSKEIKISVNKTSSWNLRKQHLTRRGGAKGRMWEERNNFKVKWVRKVEFNGKIKALLLLHYWLSWVIFNRKKCLIVPFWLVRGWKIPFIVEMVSYSLDSELLVSKASSSAWCYVNSFLPWQVRPRRTEVKEGLILEDRVQPYPILFLTVSFLL